MTSVSFYRSSLRALTLAMIAALGLMKAGCDYSLIEEPVIIPALKISITPQTADMQKGTVLDLQAIIRGYKTNGAVTWELVDSAGSLHSSGLSATYRAPDSLTISPQTVTLRVRSVEDTSRFAQAVLTIFDTVTNGGNNGGGNGSAIAIVLTPLNATIEPGQTLQFNAAVSGNANTNVSWRLVSGPGALSSAGLYAAPSSIFETQFAVIEATSLADPTVSATAMVRVRKAVDPNLVCFNPTIMDIFASNCVDAGCHNSQDRAHGLDFTNYAGIKRAVDEGHDDLDDDDVDVDDDDVDVDDNDVDGMHEIIEALRDDDGDRMPLGKPALSEEKIQLIERWIAQGAQNIDCSEDNWPGGGSTCDTTDLSFAAHINPIVQAKCAGCHSGANPPLGINLTSHAGVSSAAQSGRLVGAISHAPGFIRMPMNGAKLDACSIDKIKAWINAGSLNN